MIYDVSYYAPVKTISFVYPRCLYYDCPDVRIRFLLKAIAYAHFAAPRVARLSRAMFFVGLNAKELAVSIKRVNDLLVKMSQGNVRKKKVVYRPKANRKKKKAKKRGR